MSDFDYNEWTTEDLESLAEEILPILKERYKEEIKILREEKEVLRKENDDG